MILCKLISCNSILRESGHEHFNGSIVVPVMDENGVISEVYGRKLLGNRLRKGTAIHTYLPGPHRGVWNIQAIKISKEVILCEALIDAMTFWCAGFRNVTACYGTSGFTDDHLNVFKQYGVERVLIAYDRDEAGNTAAEKLAQVLNANGIDAYRVLFPKGPLATSLQFSGTKNGAISPCVDFFHSLPLKRYRIIQVFCDHFCRITVRYRDQPWVNAPER